MNEIASKILSVILSAIASGAISAVDGMIYTSKVNGNVYTPQLVPTNWILKEETP